MKRYNKINRTSRTKNKQKQNSTRSVILIIILCLLTITAAILMFNDQQNNHISSIFDSFKGDNNQITGAIIGEENETSNNITSTDLKNLSYTSSTNEKIELVNNPQSITSSSLSISTNNEPTVPISQNNIIQSEGLSLTADTTTCGVITTDTTLINNVTATANCFNITGSNLVLDCSGFSLTGDDNGATDYGIYVQGGDGVTIKNCFIRRFSRGIYITNSSNNVLVFNNTLVDNDIAGIYLEDSISLTAWNNTFRVNSSDDYGIYLTNGNTSNFTNNTFTGDYNLQAITISNSGSQNNNFWQNNFLSNDGISNSGTASTFCMSGTYGNFYNGSVDIAEVLWYDCGPTPNGTIYVISTFPENMPGWGTSNASYVDLRTGIYNTFNNSVNHLALMQADLNYSYGQSGTVEFIRNNVELNCMGYIYQDSNANSLISGLYFSNINGLSIHNCTFNNYDPSIYVDNNGGGTIYNNSFIAGHGTTEGYAIQFNNGDNSNISNNTFSGDWTSQALFLSSSSSSNSIWGNKFLGYDGITDNGASNNFCYNGWYGNYYNHLVDIEEVIKSDCGPNPNSSIYVNQSILSSFINFSASSFISSTYKNLQEAYYNVAGNKTILMISYYNTTNTTETIRDGVNLNCQGNLINTTTTSISVNGEKNNSFLNCPIFTTGTSSIAIDFVSGAINNYVINATINTSGSSAYGVRFSSSSNNTIVNSTFNITGTQDIQSSSSNDNVIISSIFNRNDLSVTGAGSNLYVKWYVYVNVTDQNGVLLNSAQVNITNVTNNLVTNNNITGASGLIELQTLIEFIQNTTTLTYSTPHLISGNKTGYNTNSTTINLTQTNTTFFRLVLSSSNTAPTITTPSIQPSPAYSNSTLIVNTTYSDADNNLGTVYFQWYVNGTNVFNQTNATITNGTTVFSWLNGFNFSRGNTINVSVYANDGTDNSITINSSVLTISNSAPVFNETLSSRTVNYGSEVKFLINCSDFVDGDSLTFYDNTSLFDINETNGTIIDTPSASEIGTYTINITCGDGTDNTSQTFLYTIRDGTVPTFSRQVQSPSFIQRYQNFTANISISDLNLSSYIFSSNASGILTNRTFLLQGQPSWNASIQANVSVAKNSGICWFYYANDSSNNLNQSNISCFTVQNTAAQFNETLQSRTSNVGSEFKMQLNCSDFVDGDSLTFYDNTSLFDINETNGTIIDTPSASEIGTYTINITCGDGTDNTSQTFSYTIQDITIPRVISLSPPINSIFNISNSFELGVNVTDEATISQVFVNISYPNGSAILFQLTNGTAYPNRYNLSFTAPALIGNYNLTFIANDSSNNFNKTEKTNFTINDVAAPSVTTLFPLVNSAFNISNSIEISANLTDQISVSSILANISYPNGTNTLLSLSNSTGYFSKYNASFIAPALIGRYNITFIANDSSNNINRSEKTNFTINDATAPTFSSAINTSINFRRYQNFTANISITDLNLSSYIFSTNASGILTNKTVQLSGQSNYNASEQANITQSKGTRICWSYYANDSSNNVNQSNINCFTVQNTAPQFNESLQSKTVQVGNTLNYKTNCSDIDDDIITYVDDSTLFDINPVTGQITDTPSSSDIGSHLITINCTDGQEITSQSFTYTITPAPIEPAPAAPSNGGGGGGGGSSGSSSAPKPECTKNSDCAKDQYCVNNKCLKIFDLKITYVDSPIKAGDNLDFAYFVKGMANISGDVKLTFTLQHEGEEILGGSDVIFVGNFEEKTEATSLSLPSTIKDGTYKFIITLLFEDYEISSYRTIEVKQEIPFLTSLTISPLPEITSGNEWKYSAVVSINKDEIIPSTVKRKVTKAGEVVWTKQSDLIVNRSLVIIDNVKALDPGDYQLEIMMTINNKTTIATDSFTVKSSQKPTALPLAGHAVKTSPSLLHDYSSLFIGLIIVGTIGFSYYKLRKKIKWQSKTTKDQLSSSSKARLSQQTTTNWDGLEKWVQKMRELNFSEEQIKQHALAANWSEEELASTLEKIKITQQLKQKYASWISERNITELRSFIESEAKRGQSLDKITASLVAAGWDPLIIRSYAAIYYNRIP